MGKIKIGKITLGMCQTNTYFLYVEGNSDAIVIDPADRGDLLYDKLKGAGLEPKAILLTHGHFDHIWGVEKLKELSGAQVYASEDEDDFLKDADANCSAGCGRPCTIEADYLFKDNEVISLCGIEIKVLKTPGHTKGGCCYYIAEEKFLISGDTLFSESVGRTDLPTGSMSTLIRSINEKLMVLPDDVKVYPGHGCTTNIGYERDNNPFL